MRRPWEDDDNDEDEQYDTEEDVDENERVDNVDRIYWKTVFMTMLSLIGRYVPSTMIGMLVK